MKDMEIKTENRYEYRKTQEKRKQMIAPDLFEFAYVPDWYGHLAELERLALPESWRFRKPSRETKNTETPILERYIHTIFRKQVTMENLAQEFNVTIRTIRNDIEELTLAHPIETVRGRYGGGVRVADGYYLGRKYLKPNQQELLKRLSENLTGEDLATMNSILSEFALTKRAEK